MPAHPEFALLAESWNLAMDADGYSPATLRNYQRAVRYFSEWLGEQHPGLGPAEVERDHVRTWIVQIRNETSSSSARTWFPGIRHFYRWAVDEGECSTNPTEGLRTPPPNDPRTPVLSNDELRRLIAACSGATFLDYRDSALLYVFADGGLRLAEVTHLRVDSVDIRDRILFVEGKGTNRSGPRRRPVALGVKATRKLDRYLRVRRKHPYAELDALWLGDRNRGPMGVHGVKRALQRRAESIGIALHPHMFRHTWASEFRAAGGQEGDLMVLGGWRNRQMLDRYGKTAAADRAQQAYRRMALGDRL